MSRVARFALAALAALAAACGPAAAPVEPAPTPAPAPDETPPEPAPPAPRLVTVTIVSGEIAGRMPNGQEWDAREAKENGTVDKAVAEYLARHPELSDTTDTLGVPIDAPKLGREARSSVAADPMVFVVIDERVFRSPVRPRAFHPVWEFPFQFTYGPGAVEAGTVVRILVVDYDGPTRYDTIGATVLDSADLVGEPLHELEPFGSVNKLTLQVATEERPNPEPIAKVRLAVPGRASWTDTGVDVVAGQRLAIVAADEVCSKGGDPGKCSGPEGQRAASGANLPGFPKLGHAALVGAVGDTRFPVLRERTLIAPSSGRLRLGVNDRQFGDNTGSYAAHITVEPAD